MAGPFNGFTSLPGLCVGFGGQGSFLNYIKVYTFTLTDAATVAATSTAERTYTVTGLLADDLVWSLVWTPTSGLGFGGFRVSAANTLAVQWVNPTAGAVAPSAGGKTATLVVANVFAN